MAGKKKPLLIIDGAANLILGGLLMGFPLGTGALLGVPQPESAFYPTILGAVLFGIGLALLVECFGQKATGLGLAGAIVINIFGAGVLTLWLIFAPLQMPLRGWITLWIVAVLVLIIGLAELVTGAWKD